jgi:hypothetical protein
MTNLDIWWRELKYLHGMKMLQFQQRLKHVCSFLRKWNKEVFGNIFEEKKKLEQEMEDIQQKGIQGIFSSNLTEREAKVKDDLIKRKRREETLWCQKSRIHWLKEGDKNTRFFHNSLIQRRNRNRIVAIKVQDGNTKVKEDIENEILLY